MNTCKAQVREIIHTDYEGRLLKPTDIDDCILDNLKAPVVRSGAEAFKSYYAVEWCYHVYSAIDPTRSYVETIVKAMEDWSSAENNWPASDAIHYLLRDLGFDQFHLSTADFVAFWTIFPNGVSDFLSLPYMKWQVFNNPHGDYVRVLNNPFFHRDPNAPERRLVWIAELSGFKFALDRACFIATPAVIAKELALLNYACKEPKKVGAIVDGLTTVIAETMSDWGLIPTAREDVCD